MDIDLLSHAILLVLGFIAPFLNVIVGGGGLSWMLVCRQVQLSPQTGQYNETSMLTFV